MSSTQRTTTLVAPHRGMAPVTGELPAGDAAPQSVPAFGRPLAGDASGRGVTR
jgi:hypothetical protein